MKLRSRLFSALLATMMVVLLFTPMAFAAVQGAPLGVMQSASQRLEVFKKDNYGATDTTVLYRSFTAASSGNPDIADIYQRGESFYIVGKAHGTTTYTVTTASGETFSGTVSVFKRWTSPVVGSGGGSGGPTLHASGATTVTYGGRVSFVSISGVTAANFVPSEYAWSVSPGSAGTVSSGGVFTAAASGNHIIDAVVTATKDGKAYSAPVKVVSTSAFYFPSASINVGIGSSHTLTPQYYIGGGAQSGTWSSNNTGIATVDQSGVVRGVARGTATITRTDGTFSQSVSVKVGQTFTLSSSRASVDYYYYGGYVSVTGATASSLNWYSSDSYYLTVDGNGNFYRQRHGGGRSVRITATDPNSGYSAYVDIIVY